MYSILFPKWVQHNFFDDEHLVKMLKINLLALTENFPEKCFLFLIKFIIINIFTLLGIVLKTLVSNK